MAGVTLSAANLDGSDPVAAGIKMWGGIGGVREANGVRWIDGYF